MREEMIVLVLIGLTRMKQTAKIFLHVEGLKHLLQRKARRGSHFPSVRALPLTASPKKGLPQHHQRFMYFEAWFLLAVHTYICVEAWFPLNVGIGGAWFHPGILLRVASFISCI